MPPLFETAVVIGKFYPPHRGHKHLIDTACEQAKHVTVICCCRQGEVPAGNLRAEWLSQIHPGVTVLTVEDTYPPDDSALWARLTIGWLGVAPAAVFTSEAYGDDYARHLGAVHVAVDPARRRFPCSGTGIRNDPLRHWDCLEPCVRAHYVKRVCVVGAESSGTTTLTQQLADHYQTVWVPEYGREFTERYRSFGGADWRSEDFLTIAEEQLRREDDLALEANRILFCDTDALATSIWHERYVGRVSDEVLRIGLGRRYDLYLVTDVDIPFVQDGYRDGEHLRTAMHRRFVDELSRLDRPFAVIGGSRDERLSKAVSLIDERVLAPRIQGDGTLTHDSAKT